MFRIDTPNAVTAPGGTTLGTGWFSDGDPNIPRLPTEVSDEWLNAVAGSFLAFLTRAGIAESKVDYTRVLQAVIWLISPPPSDQAGSYSVLATDFRRLVTFTGASAATLNLPSSAAVTPGFEVRVRHAGTAVLTLDPAGADLIEGAATLTMQRGEVRDMVWDGAAWRALPIFLPTAGDDFAFFMGQS